MNKHDPISSNQTRLNTKFDYLLSKIMRSHTREFHSYHQMEKTIQTRFSKLVSSLNKKVEENCVKELEEIKLYSTEFDKTKINLKELEEKNENFENFRIRPGNEKEFTKAFQNLTKCTKEILGISEELKDKFKVMTDLTKNTYEFCIEECKRDVLELLKTESETTECLESCWRYKKLNMETSFNIAENLLENKEKFLQYLQ